MAQRERDEAARAALAAAMRDLIAKMGGKQKDVVDKLGLSQRAVSEILNKKTSPRIETLIVMRNALGRSVDSLLGLAPIGADAMIAELRDRMARGNGFGSVEARAKLEGVKRRLVPELPPAPTKKRKKRENG